MLGLDVGIGEWWETASGTRDEVFSIPSPGGMEVIGRTGIGG